MKYIDADRLRAEIEKLDIQNTSDLWDGEDDDQCYGYDLALDHIKRLIDSLQQEQKEMDINGEIHKEAMKLHTAPTYDELAHFANHFYELGRRAER